MEELIVRVSAILDSPILRYTRHKTYRQISILCLVYLLIFCINAFAAQESSYEFEPFTKKNTEEKIKTDINSHGAGDKYITNEENHLKKMEQSAKAMADVEKLLIKLEKSVKELIEANPIADEDKEAILKALAQVDGVLSYTYEQLKSGKEQLSTIIPVTDEEKTKYNSLKVRFMSYMSLTNDLKKIIAEKLADASKRNEK